MRVARLHWIALISFVVYFATASLAHALVMPSISVTFGATSADVTLTGGSYSAPNAGSAEVFELRVLDGANNVLAQRLFGGNVPDAIPAGPYTLTYASAPAAMPVRLQLVQNTIYVWNGFTYVPTGTEVVRQEVTNAPAAVPSGNLAGLLLLVFGMVAMAFVRHRNSKHTAHRS